MAARLTVSALVFLACFFVSSCGGGSVTTSPPPPPPPPPPAGDFSLQTESPTVTIQQGGALQFETILVTPLNGFTGTVNFKISGLPTGVTTFSSVPLSIAIPQLSDISFQLASSPSSVVGTTTVTVTATSGAIVHTATFSLTITSAAPFAIQVSPSSLSLTPASTARVQISLTANPGTSPQLITNVSSAPNSSQVNVGSPQALLTVGNPQSFLVSATELAQPLQNYPIIITATDSSGNASTFILPLSVTVPFSSNTTPTRSTFVRTDKAPTGMVYDSFRKLLFVSVEILNEVDVLSTLDGHKVASISVPFPGGIDESSDGSAVYVASPYFGGVTTISPDLLQVVHHSDVPASISGLTQSVTFFQVAALSNGRVLFYPTYDMVDLTKPPLYSWDPTTDTFSRFGPQTLATSGGLISRSFDHSKLLSYGGVGGSGFIYDATTGTFSGPITQLGAASAAVNSNGTQLAAAENLNALAVLAFYDSNFNLLGSLPLSALYLGSGPIPLLAYSTDGKRLYVVPNQGIGAGAGCAAAGVIDTTTFSLLGVVPCFSFGAVLPFSGEWITTFALDETNMFFGAAFGGVGFLDMNSPTFLQEPLPGTFLVQPSLLSDSSPTQIQLNGAGLSQDLTFNLFVGAPPASPNTIKATGFSVQSQNIANATIPQGSTPGPANATLTRADGFFEIVPDAVTFGPTILRVDADAGSPSGGDVIKLVGYGFDAPNVEVSIRGKTATITQTTGSIPDQLFPTQTITLKSPPGSPGPADVTVSAPGGSATLPGAFQYLNSVQVFPMVGALDAIIYDQSRKRLYVANQDHNRTEVFDLISGKFLAPVTVGNAPTSLALTPDAQLIAALNSSDGTVSVIDATKLQILATYTVLTPSDLDKQACGGVAIQISPVAPHRMLVSVNCSALLDQGLSHLVNLDSGSLSCVGVAGCASNGTDFNLGLGAAVMASTPDATKVFFTANDVGLLDVNANTLTTGVADGSFSDAAISADGTTFAAAFGTYRTTLARISIMAFEPFADSGSQSLHNVIGEKLHPSGSLLFFPQDSGVDIFDVHTGRLVEHVVLPDSIPLDTNGMALDETGTTLFLISSTGITVAELNRVPLSLGTVTPSTGPSGTTLTIRGSGFANGAKVSFGTVQSSVKFIDSNTLQVVVPTLPTGPVRLTVELPDGRHYSIDDAFTAN